ncbi:MAG TPA: DUF4136 domain-containing protein [Panacibacter sp.]|nr:DUF4136 domain-containing protein [Panacibacter sp.]
MKINICWLLLVFFAASCGTSVKVTSDYDKAASFTAYKSFSVYNLKTTGSVSQINADRIANAIKADMIKKGFVENNSNPDLMINAVTVLKDKQQVTSTTNYYGYGGLYRPYGYWGGGIASGYTSVNTYDYKNGTLQVDIVDAKTQKMVWQGTGDADIDKTPKDPDAFITGAVTKIMADFPPGNVKK